MRATITGHRPDRLGGDYSLRAPVWGALRNALLAAFTRFDIDAINSGMALGVDTVATIAALDTSRAVHAFLPFDGQESRWPPSAQQRYRQLLAQATSQTVVAAGGYAAWKMHARNAAMNDTADLVLAVWDGSRSGGTFRCVEDAVGKGLPVWRLDPDDGFALTRLAGAT